jgi:hypothetical protein
MDGADETELVRKSPAALLLVLGLDGVDGAGENGLLDVGSVHLQKKGLNRFQPPRRHVAMAVNNVQCFDPLESVHSKAGSFVPDLTHPKPA